MKIKILHETDTYLVLDKPAGLLVHADGTSKEPTLVDWILEKYPSLENVGEPLRLKTGDVINRPGIVHRLDRDTSGVLVVAKTQDSYLYLKEQFQSHTIRKEYVSFVYGWIKDDMGKIEAPIGRSKNDFRKRSATRGARGDLRPAETHYRVSKRGCDAQGNKATYLVLFPKTGRTHQIRVHMSYLNHPIIGDTLYAEGKEKLFGFTRQALHARSLSFLGLENEEISVSSPLPEDFVSALAALEDVC